MFRGENLDRAVDERIERVVERISAQKDAFGRTLNASLERRLARDHVLNELPKLLSRLSAGICVLNDRLGDGGVRLVLSVAERTPTTEAVFTVTVDDGGDGPDMSFNIDYAGRLTAMLVRGGNRSLVRVSTVFDVDAAFLLDCLLVLLEARYPPIQES